VDGGTVGSLGKGVDPLVCQVGEADQAVFGHQQDGGGGEGLDAGGEAEVGLGGDGGAGSHVGQAVAAAHDGLAVAQHEHGGAGDVAVVVGHDHVDGVGFRRGCRFGGATVGAGGQRGEERDEE